MEGTIVNQLLLSGVICRQPIRKQSPSGITHCLFVLKHRSQQQEAGYWRQAWCRMEVIISGHHADEMLTNQLTAGSQVEVRGFLSNSQGHRGLNRLVLHARSIKLTYSGE